MHHCQDHYGHDLLPLGAYGVTWDLGCAPAYPGVGDSGPQLLQVPDEAAVGLHVGVLDQLGQILFAHTWEARGAARWPYGALVKRWGVGKQASQDWWRPWS